MLSSVQPPMSLSPLSPSLLSDKIASSAKPRRMAAKALTEAACPSGGGFLAYDPNVTLDGLMRSAITTAMVHDAAAGLFSPLSSPLEGFAAGDIQSKDHPTHSKRNRRRVQVKEESYLNLLSPSLEEDTVSRYPKRHSRRVRGEEDGSAGGIGGGSGTPRSISLAIDPVSPLVTDRKTESADAAPAAQTTVRPR